MNANFLLQHLADTDLDYEKAILHGKLGQHDSALEILVNNLQNYEPSAALLLSQTVAGQEENHNNSDKRLRKGRLMW